MYTKRYQSFFRYNGSYKRIVSLFFFYTVQYLKKIIKVEETHLIVYWDSCYISRRKLIVNLLFLYIFSLFQNLKTWSDWLKPSMEETKTCLELHYLSFHIHWSDWWLENNINNFWIQKRGFLLYKLFFFLILMHIGTKHIL